MESTFRIEGQAAGSTSTIGTCFILGKPMKTDPKKAFYVLVTANHVLDEIKGDTATLYLRMKTKGGSFESLPYRIRIRERSVPLWLRHPNQTIDIAAMAIGVPAKARIRLLSTDLLADDSLLTKYEIHPGDEMSCLGFPMGMETNPGRFPILRSGRIASYPITPTTATLQILFDFNVFPGNSGGPVYLVDRNRYFNGATNVGSIVSMIMGLLSQEVKTTTQYTDPNETFIKSTPLSLGVVIPASFIKDVVNLVPEPKDFSEGK
jgi:hypothetical protein